MRRWLYLVTAVVIGISFSLLTRSTPTQAQTAPVGRYAFSTTSGIVMLLDTSTGKVWRQTRYTDLVGEPVVFEYMNRIDNDAALRAWLATQKIDASKSAK